MKHFLCVAAIVLAAAMTHAQFAGQTPPPASHTAGPAKGTTLPPILTLAQLAEAGLTAPAQKESYKAAVKASAAIYQMPCYCYCDRGHGHTSLRSCFESAHGANCSTCMQEALYTYQQSKQGWSTQKIRDGIMKGDFKTLDLQHPAPVM
jgi:hypothetical protein